MRGLIILLALVGLIGGGGYAVREYAPQYLPDQLTTDAVLMDRLRTQITEDGRAEPFFAKFETLFPADYNELMTQLVALYRRGGTEQQAMRLGESYMTSFIEDNQQHVAAAEPAVLTELGRAISNGTTLLREENVVVCGEAFRSSSSFNAPVEGMSTPTQDAFVAISVQMLEGIASGKRAPTQYVEPSQAQWLALVGRYQELGGDVAALEASANPVMMRRLPPDAVCGMVDLLWKAALQAEDDFLPRFVSHSMRQG